MRDLFIITGTIEDINRYARQLEKELMRSTDDAHVDYQKLAEIAEQAEETLAILTDELEGEE